MKLVSHMNELEQTIHNLEVIRDSHNWHNEEREDCKDAINRAIALLKEQEKLVDVDALREKLGLAKDCAKCKQNSRACRYDSHFSLMDFCDRFDMAIKELM